MVIFDFSKNGVHIITLKVKLLINEKKSQALVDLLAEALV